MGIFFPNDASFDYEFLRALSLSRYQGADLSEVLRLVPAIKPGDFESWHDAFYQLAQRVEAETYERVGDVPDSQLTASQRVTIKDRLFAASAYYRVADFFLHGDPSDPRIKALWEKQIACFDRALAAIGNGTRHTLKSAKGDFEVPITVYTASGSGPKPTVIICNGFDGAQEEMMHTVGFASLDRGFNVITYEGPGQCSVVRDQGAGFIHDWERAVTPVVDFAIANAEAYEIDPAKLVLLGYSLGGWLAVRAAAFEHRLAACVALDGVWDASSVFTNALPPDTLGLWRGGASEDRPRFDEEINKLLASGSLPTGGQWALEHALWAFCTRSPVELFDRFDKFKLEGVIGGVQCPVFIGEAKTDLFYQGEPQILKNALGDKGHLCVFTEETGASAHCSVGGATYMNAAFFAWLDKHL